MFPVHILFLVFLFPNLLYATDIDNVTLQQEPEVEVVTPPAGLSITVQMAHDIAQDILDEIFKLRHAPIHQELNESRTGSKLMELESVRGDFINRETEILDGLEFKKLKHGRLSEKEIMALARVTERLKKVEDMTVTSYLDRIENIVTNSKSLDAVTISISATAIYVAGNIKTRLLQYEVADIKMLSSVVDGKVTFDYVDFGFQHSDSIAVEKAVSKYEELLGIPVYMVRPKMVENNSEWMEYEDQKETLLYKLGNKLRVVEGLQDPTGDRNLLDTEKQEATEEFCKEMAKLDRYLGPQLGDLCNALQRIKPKDISLLGISRTLCKICLDPVTEVSRSEEKQFKISTNLKRLELIAMNGSGVTQGLPRIATEEKSMSRDFDCEHGREDTRKECSFMIDDDAGFVGIDAKKFLEAYTASDSNGKLELTLVLEKFRETLNLKGTPENVKKVAIILEQHKMKVYNEGLQATAMATASGNLKGLDYRKTRISPRIAAMFLNKTISRRQSPGMPRENRKPVLSKHVVEGIQDNDIAGLSLMGAEVAIDFVEYSTGLFSNTAKSAARAEAKGFKALGKMARPIGANVDEAHSAWSIINSGRRLTKPSAAGLDENTAVEHTMEPIDGLGTMIALTLIGLVVAVALCVAHGIGAGYGIVKTVKFALYGGYRFLLGMAFGFMLVFSRVPARKSLVQQQRRLDAMNYVQSLDNKLKLLDYEMDIQTDKYMRSKQISKYIQDLIEAKEANNNIVSAVIKKLEDLPHISAIFVPSRSVPKNSKCTFNLKECKSCSGTQTSKKRHCDKWETSGPAIASECFEGGICRIGNSFCITRRPPQGVFKMTGCIYHWGCSCPETDTTDFGELGGDSVIDLEYVGNLHEERCAPDPISSPFFEYACLPSSLKYDDDHVSQLSNSTGHYCKNAIGIRRKGNGGNYTLFDLGNGTDTIRVSGGDQNSNRFNLGEGEKLVTSGAGNDVFFINGPCNNFMYTLDGGGGQNTLAVATRCKQGVHMVMDLTNERHFKLKNIQAFYGIENEGDNVVLPCGFKFIYGLGGNKNSWDTITLQRGHGCSQAATVISASYTFVNIDVHPNAPSTVVVPEKIGSISLAHRNPKNGMSTVLLQYPSRSFGNVVQTSDIFTLSTVRNDTIKLQEADDFQVLLQEGNDDYSHLLLGRNQTATCYHSLSNKTHVERKGCQQLPNVFDVTHVSGNLIGGNSNDVFNVSLPFKGTLSGFGGKNSLLLNKGNENVTTVTVHLDNHADDDSEIMATAIHEYWGMDGFPETVYLGCDIILVTTGGGIPESPDVIVINNPLCGKLLSATIHVAPHTIVKNERTDGALMYVIKGMDGIDLETLPSQTARHTYVFLQEMGSLTSASIHEDKLNLTFIHGHGLQLHLGGYNETTGVYLSPVVQIQSHGGSVMALSLFKEARNIVASLHIRDGFEHLPAVANTQNQFVIEAGNTTTLGKLQGGAEKDVFILKSMNSLRSLDGGGGFDELVIHGDLFPVANLTLEMRGKGRLYTSENLTIISEIKNVEVVTGRGTVYLSCNTQGVKGFQMVVISPMQCRTNRSIQIHVGEETEVEFQYNGRYHNVTYHYIFEKPRSFNISVYMWIDIRDARQVYHLPWKLEELEELFCDQWKGQLYFVTSNGTYVFRYDNRYTDSQQFHANPVLRLKDGYVVRIDRYGGILVVGAKLDWSEQDDNQLAKTYGDKASKLEVTFLLTSEESKRFIYAGYDGTTNMLTNTEQKSLLLGGGAMKTTYVILQLQEDVKIYPGFREEDDGNSTHILDLTNIIYPIRRLSEATGKYVPTVEATEEGHIEIFMEGYRDMFPATVNLVNGTSYASRIQILLDSVAMQLSPTSRVRRDNGQKPWVMEPLPLVVDGTELTVMSLEDFEVGQQIILVDSSGNNVPILGGSSKPFKGYGNGSAVILSNVESTSMQGVKSLVISDMMQNHTSNVTRRILETLKISVQSDGETEPMIELDITSSLNKENSEGWISALVKLEEKMIAEVPEIPRTYSEENKTHLYLTFGGVGATISALLILGLIFLWKKIYWSHIMVVSKGTTADGDMELVPRYTLKEED